jgi:4-aminobutyrate aminotransferase / (S)-3-amino-2-methylpropionate transaminase / 5-aminovalerate transaminase
VNSSFRWSHAVGFHVWDKAGREYLDFTSGIFAANTGHSNARIFVSIYQAARQCGLHAYTYATDIRDRYEARLCEWTGYEDCHLFTTGSEAVEAALRVMGIDEDGIMAIEDCFHGKTAGPRTRLYRMPVATIQYAFSMPWIIEGYRGWDAYFWESEVIEYLRSCQTRDNLVCFDEVQSGFGRTGKKFAFEHYGIRPDLLVIGKGAFSGFPGSAVLASNALLGPWHDEFSSTHGGNPLQCAAGLATIDEFDRLNLIEEAERKGVILHNALRAISYLDGCALHGRGMVAAITTPDIGAADRIVLGCRAKGLLVVRTGKATVKLGPPLTITDEALLQGVNILKEVINCQS